MRRREFIAGVGSAAAWPMVARAQAERTRRVGVFLTLAADDPQSKLETAEFQRVLAERGWIEGRNLQIDYRAGLGDSNNIRKYAAELVALAPDVIFVIGTANAGTLLQATRSVPIVFVFVADPVGAGFVDSLTRPGGNATGFLQFEYGLSGKWLEVLKQIAPDVRRVAVMRDPAITAGIGQFGAIQAMAPSLGLDVSPLNVRDAGEMERTLASFAGSGNGGLIVTGSALAGVHRALIVALAARYKLPAVYFTSSFVAAGGLISYGPNIIDQ
jgi:putative tryptophan/tyrosine transport system substrate-binding protein